MFTDQKIRAIENYLYSYFVTQFINKNKKITESSYNTVNPRIVFVSNPVLKLNKKDLISTFDMRLMVYKFERSYERSNIGHTSRHVVTRIQEHIAKFLFTEIY